MRSVSYGVFALNVIGCHVGVQVIIIYQEKIRITYFNLNSFTTITNIKLIRFQGSAHSSFVCSCKQLHAGIITDYNIPRACLLNRWPVPAMDLKNSRLGM